MKYNKNIISILFFNSLLVLIINSEIHELPSITFGDTAQSPLNGEGIFKVLANYNTDVSQKYLYIYPLNYEKELYLNKAIFKIYFKEISNDEPQVNYLDSDYSTLDFNSGLFIEISSLKKNKAYIFIIAYDSANLLIQYKYVNEVSFPKKTYLTNLQLNQFKLGKGATKTIDYEYQSLENEYLMILSKTSLRNIEVSVKYKENDYTKEIITSLYPNGYSIFIDTKEKKVFDTKYFHYYITIKSKSIRDEVILLGYMHHEIDEIFTNKLVNGYQMYLETNNNKLYYLPNVQKNRMNQYFTYQVFSKEGKMIFQGSSLNEYHYFKEYNSMIKCNVDSNSDIKFDFSDGPKRNALYIQYIDYNDIKVAQKSLQPLVSGSPKSMLIPEKSSMYHFLPRERESNNINFYLRSKTPDDQNMFISFKTCKNYPEECVYTGKDENSINLINNLGLWYSEKTSENELQIIYVYCEKECAYDILMTYDNDPLFMFPENNYTKFIGEEGQDIFILPAFEYLSTNQSINIDLSVISGNAELTLYKSLNIDPQTQLNNQKEIIGNKQSYIISSDSFVNSDYYKKDIYAVVKGDKNTFYNLMYGAGATNDKILDNNRVIVESVYVDENKKKNFTFFNHEDNLYISISTLKCKSKINIDGKEVSSDKNNYVHEAKGKGYHVVQIYLIEDESLCKKGQKEEVILYAYNSDNTNILLSENTLVSGLVKGKEITFRHIFKPDFEQNNDNSLSVELERLSDSKSLKFEYKLEKISFSSSASKSSTNSHLNTYVFAKKANLISNKQIKDVCGSLEQNEICSLTLTLSVNSLNEFSFSLYLNKNSKNIPRHIVDESLINTISQNSIRYYYIDANKDYDTEILINSFGQDLYYNYAVESGDNLDSKNIQFKKSDFRSSSNYHKIQVAGKDCSGSPCRIYLGVYAKEKSSDKEAPTTYEISYLFKQNNEKKTNVKLPPNYWAQYSFDTLKEITYTLQSYYTGKFLFELYTIKENDNDNCEVVATFSNDKLTSTEGSKVKEISKEESIAIKSNTKDSKCKFRFRASFVGKDNTIVPILPYSSEKCVIKNKGACYYALDISPDNEADNVYFYIPESEDAYISVAEVEHGLLENQEKSLQDTLSKLTMSDKDKVKRSNWHVEEITKRNITLIVGVKTQTLSNINLTLYSSFYNKPEEVTLDQGEKKIFTIDKTSKSNAMTLKIKKSNSQFNKYKINIHSVKGNGLFSLLSADYPLGFDYNSKESISILVDESDNDMEIVAKNQYNDASFNEFTFSIDYTVSTSNQLFNELEPSKINSYKIIKPGAADLSLSSFYMKANSTNDNYMDVNMNVKIFSSTPNFEINAYIVGDDFIKEKLTDVNKQPERSANGEVITYIGGENTDTVFTLSKIEIAGSKLKEFKAEINKEIYVYVTFSTKEKINNVRIDIYPYDITNNLPLAQHELFIHKLPAGTLNYQLLLVKSDNEFKNMYIEYLSPSSSRYKFALGNLNGQKEAIKKNDTNIIDTNDNFLFFGKNKLKVDENLEKNKLRYLLFNVFAEDNNQETKADQFVFKYKSYSNSYSEIFNMQDQDFHLEDSSGYKFVVDASLPSFSSGNSVLIIKGYKKSEIEVLNVDEDHLSLYLLFSDIKPSYTFYKSLNKEQIKKKLTQEFAIEWKEEGGEYYFICANIIVDNERTEFLGYKAFKHEMKSSSSQLLDYMRNHIFATIVIIIIILFFCGMICNIIRIDRKPNRQTVEKIEVDKIMEDM